MGKSIKWGDGLAHQIEEFYERNPDEEMLYADIVTRYGVTIKTAHNAVNELCRMGVLETAHIIRRKAKP